MRNYSYEISGFVRAVFFRDTTQETENTTQETENTTQETENTTQELLLALIKKTPAVTREELAEFIDLTPDGVKYHLDKMRKEGIIEHRGPTKRGHWIILQEKEVEEKK